MKVMDDLSINKYGTNINQCSGRIIDRNCASGCIVDGGKVTYLILVDLNATFNTVDHHFMLGFPPGFPHIWQMGVNPFCRQDIPQRRPHCLVGFPGVRAQPRSVLTLNEPERFYHR